MPRQDVPYGGAICRLKERIAEIWDELGKKLHSINGVEGDGAGDVKIVSGDPAVVITSDQANHQIEVALDSSQLPAASVSSVNGQTGAVALDAGDIPSDGNSDVQTDIDINKAAISACSSAITSEQLARQNADSTLQGNINAVSASIPGAAATAVANDPTVTQLVTDLAGKVDLSDVSTVETPDTIAKRNGSGRLVAADPASGATDKTLVTANWISQTGDSSPNNLVHKSGNETINNVKTFTAEIVGFLKYRWYCSAGTNMGKWVKIASMPSNMVHFFVEMDSRYDHTILTGSSVDMITKTNSINVGAQSKFTMVKESDGTFTLWYQLRSNYNTYYVRFINAERYASELTVTILTDPTAYNSPTPGVSSYDSMEMVQ